MSTTHTSLNDTLFQAAQQHIPGGVNSPVRAFKAVGGTPRFIDRAEGAYIFDVDGKRYIDYVLSWGPMLLGHAYAPVVNAVTEQIKKGLSFGAPTEIETRLADKLCDIVPGMDMVRMVNSGTEATMSAIRLARGATGRDKIIKFEGCYHGHSDSLLIKAGSGALTFGVPSSPGVPAALAEHTVTLSYNDIDGVKAAFEQFGKPGLRTGMFGAGNGMAGNKVDAFGQVWADIVYDRLFAATDVGDDGAGFKRRANRFGDGGIGADWHAQNDQIGIRDGFDGI